MIKKKFILGLLLIMSIQSFSQKKSWDLRQLEDINLTRNFDVDKPLEQLSNSTDFLAIGIPVGMLAIGYLNNQSDLKKEGYNAAISTFAAYGSGFVLKKLVNRDRPFIKYPHIKNYRDYQGGSFPSGTTTLAFSTATSLALSYPKWYVIAPSALYASTVGYARLHLGAHYPSDVLAGAALGIGTAFASRKLNQWVRNETRKKKLKRINLD